MGKNPSAREETVSRLLLSATGRPRQGFRSFSSSSSGDLSGGRLVHSATARARVAIGDSARSSGRGDGSPAAPPAGVVVGRSTGER